MPNSPEYKCTQCGMYVGRELLTVKKVQFMAMGSGAKTLRTRVTDWLCPPCIVKDQHWNQPAFEGRRETRGPDRPMLTPDRGSATIDPSGKDEG